MEVVLIVAVFVILSGVKFLPKIARGLGEGVMHFRKGMDEEAHDAGESLGGIYGKPAAEALTPDNQTAELYDPAALHREEKVGGGPKAMRFGGWIRLLSLIWHSLFKHLKQKV
jgi:Sec-independent protein translocase protein TatA